MNITRIAKTVASVVTVVTAATGLVTLPAASATAGESQVQAPSAASAQFGRAVVCFKHVSGARYPGPKYMESYSNGRWYRMADLPRNTGPSYNGCDYWPVPVGLSTRWATSYNVGGVTFFGASPSYKINSASQPTFRVNIVVRCYGRSCTGA